MQGYTVKEAATVLGVPRKRVWELIARGVLAGSPEAGGGMRVFLGAGSMPATPTAQPERPHSPTNGNGGTDAAPGELSPFRELLTEFRNLTERYGQALLALGEARGEVAALRSRVDLLEARMDLRLPGPSADAPVAWTATPIPPSTEHRLEPVAPEAAVEATSLAPAVDLPPVPAETPTAEVVAVAKRRRKERAKPKTAARRTPATRADAATARRTRSTRPGAAGIAAALARAADPSKGLPDADAAASQSVADAASPAAAAPIVIDDDAVLPAVAAAAEPVDVADAEPMVAVAPPVEPDEVALDVEAVAPAVEPAVADADEGIAPWEDTAALEAPPIHEPDVEPPTLEPAPRPEPDIEAAIEAAFAPPAIAEPELEATEALAPVETPAIEAPAAPEPEFEATEAIAPVETPAIEAPAVPEPELEAVDGAPAIPGAEMEAPAEAIATPVDAAAREPVDVPLESVDEPATPESAAPESAEDAAHGSQPEAGTISAGIEPPMHDPQHSALLETPEVAADERAEPPAPAAGYGPHYSTVIEEPDWLSEADLDVAEATVAAPPDEPEAAPPIAEATVAAPPDEPETAPPIAEATVAAPPNEPEAADIPTPEPPFSARAAAFFEYQSEPEPEPRPEPEPEPEPEQRLEVVPPPPPVAAQAPQPTIERPVRRDLPPAPTPMTEYPEEETILWLGALPEEPGSEEYAAEMEVATAEWRAGPADEAAPESSAHQPPPPEDRTGGGGLPDDVDPDEMELGGYQPTPRERPSTTHDMPGGRELDEALAELDAIAQGEPPAPGPSASTSEPPPAEPDVDDAGDPENVATRAIDRLRRLFPG